MWVKCLIPVLANPTTIRIAPRVQGTKYDKSQVPKGGTSSNYQNIFDDSAISTHWQKLTGFQQTQKMPSKLSSFLLVLQKSQENRVLANRSYIAFKAR